MAVTFFGHADTEATEDLGIWLKDNIEKQIQHGETLFYLGGYGAFDRLAAKIVWEEKKTFSSIQSILVLPFINRAVDTICFDGTVYPPIETVPPRFAILYRNRWMIDESEIVIAGVCRSWGGAYKAIQYAMKKQKRIINYYDWNPE